MCNQARAGSAAPVGCDRLIATTMCNQARAGSPPPVGAVYNRANVGAQ